MEKGCQDRMMSKGKISVFIITYNEEKNISRCLESVKWADEIVIVDSLSDDKTVGLCRKYTDSVYGKEFTNFSDMKNFALSKTSNAWAFSIDADEEVTEELHKKIKDVINKNNEAAGYYIKRKSCIFGRWFRFCGTQDDYQMRLFRSGKAEYYQPVHELITIDGITLRINEPMLHHTYETVSEYFDRLNKYTTTEAVFLASRGEKFTLCKILMKPMARFIKLYILRFGFLDGREGLFFSIFFRVLRFCEILQIMGNL